MENEINKLIHEKIFGLCYHDIEDENPKSITQFNCKKCDWSESIMADGPDLPDYTTDLNAVARAEAAVIEKVGLIGYGKALWFEGSHLLLNADLPSDVDDDDLLTTRMIAVLATAPASIRCRAILAAAGISWEGE